MNAQEIFDKVVTHLRAQGCPAMIDGDCRYRLISDDERVLKCAVGCLIPNEEYNPGLEGETICSLIDNKAFSESFQEEIYPHLDLLDELQSCHDSVPFADWEQRFALIAAEYGLKLL